MDSHPSRKDLELLLEQRLAEEVSARIAAHVDACLACQVRLERLTNRAWNELPLPLRVLNAPCSPEIAGKEEPFPVIPGYEITCRLGSGRTGIVYQARDLENGRKVAVKCLRRTNDLAALARFQNEAQALQRLQHPGIVQIYGTGEGPEQAFLVMEYVAGPRLREHLQQGPIDPKTAATVVAGLAEAVEAAHRAGVLHRDLKPENILLAPDSADKARERVCSLSAGYQLKIIDFGLALLCDDDAALTATDQALCTPNYAAPEQASGQRERIGPATDVYALGVILYELLTGNVPFRGLNVLDTLRHVCDRDPVSPRQLQPSVPRDLETICLKCLEKEPARRYAGADALAEDLARFLNGKPICARPTSFADKSWRWCRRNPAVAALTGMVTLIALVSFVAVMYQWRRAVIGETLAQAAQQDQEEQVRQLRQLLGRLLSTTRTQFLGMPSTQHVQLEYLLEIESTYVSLLERVPADRELSEDIGLLYATIGAAHAERGQPDKAERAWLKAHATWKELLDTRSEPRYQDYLLESQLGLAGCFRSQGRINEAIAALEQVFHLYGNRDHPASFEAVNMLAALKVFAGARADAMQLLETTLVRLEVLAAREPENHEWTRHLGCFQATLGDFLMSNAQFDEAWIRYGKAYPLLRQAVFARPNDLAIQFDTARAGHALARLCHQRNAPLPPELSETVAYLEQVLPALWRCRHLDHANQSTLGLLLGCIQRLQDCYNWQGQVAKAGRMADSQSGLLKELLESGKRSHDVYECLGMMEKCMGLASIQTSEQSGALQAVEVLAEHAAQLDSIDLLAKRRLADVWENIADQWRWRGRESEAARAAHQSVTLYESLQQAAPADPFILARHYGVLMTQARIHRKAGRTEDALRIYRRIAALHEQRFSSDPAKAEYRQELGRAYGRAGFYCQKAGLLAEAADWFLKEKALWPRAPKKLREAAADFKVLAGLVGNGRASLTAEEKREKARYIHLFVEAEQQADKALANVILLDKK